MQAYGWDASMDLKRCSRQAFLFKLRIAVIEAELRKGKGYSKGLRGNFFIPWVKVGSRGNRAILYLLAVGHLPLTDLCYGLQNDKKIMPYSGIQNQQITLVYRSSYGRIFHYTFPHEI